MHLFLYLQMVTQFSTLQDLASRLRERMISADAMKRFVGYVRCASYPDLEAYKQERSRVEKSWPAYAEDMTLSRLPPFFGGRHTLQRRYGSSTIGPGCNTA